MTGGSASDAVRVAWRGIGIFGNLEPTKWEDRGGDSRHLPRSGTTRVRASGSATSHLTSFENLSFRGPPSSRRRRPERPADSGGFPFDNGFNDPSQRAAEPLAKRGQHPSGWVLSRVALRASSSQRGPTGTTALPVGCWPRLWESSLN